MTAHANDELHAVAEAAGALALAMYGFRRRRAPVKTPHGHSARIEAPTVERPAITRYPARPSMPSGLITRPAVARPALNRTRMDDETNPNWALYGN